MLDRQRDRRRELLPRHDQLEDAERHARATTTASRASCRASSIDAGESVDLRVDDRTWEVPYHVEIYRTGHYGGTQGRLISTIPGLIGQYPPSCCDESTTTTGLVDCSELAGRRDDHDDRRLGVGRLPAQARPRGQRQRTTRSLLVVRDDGSDSDVLYGVPTSTYQALQRFERQVALRRPQRPAQHGLGRQPRREGLVRPAVQRSRRTAPTRTTGTRAPTSPPSAGSSSRATTRRTSPRRTSTPTARSCRTTRCSSPARHDEYWSQQMFDAAIAARDAGTSLVFLGANAVYWKVRFEPSPVTGAAEPRDGRLQDDPERPVGPERHLHDHLARPGRPEPARERADRPDVRRREPGARLPAARVGGRGPQPLLALHAARRPRRRHLLVDRHRDRRLGVGRAGGQRPRAGRRPDARRRRRSTASSSRTTAASSRLGTTTRQLDDLPGRQRRARVFATGTNNWWRGLGAQRPRRRRAGRADPAGDGERARRHGRAPDHAGRRPHRSIRSARRP